MEYDEAYNQLDIDSWVCLEMGYTSKIAMSNWFE